MLYIVGFHSHDIGKRQNYREGNQVSDCPGLGERTLVGYKTCNGTEVVDT